MILNLDTPALLLDYKKLEANINTMTDVAKKNGISIRPHIKTHKSINIAKMQIQAGAIGITVAKLGEAEVMAAGGITDILVAFPIASEQKIRRIINLLEKGINVKVSVDSNEQADYLHSSLKDSGQYLEVWIKVNSGLNRCGVEPGQAAVSLAKHVSRLPHLKLGGIFTHAGHSYAAKSLSEIEHIGIQEANAVIESANECERNGIPIKVRSVGSTPTYKIAGTMKGITEVRPGNAAFFDMIQVGLGVATTDQCALKVLASVVAKHKNRVIFDTGSKALCLDKGAHGNETVTGYGQVVDYPEVIIERLSEEHGIGVFSDETPLRLNDKVMIIPNHACTVANMFEEYIVHKDGAIVDHWKVDARGMLK